MSVANLADTYAAFADPLIRCEPPSYSSTVIPRSSRCFLPASNQIWVRQLVVKASTN